MWQFQEWLNYPLIKLFLVNHSFGRKSKIGIWLGNPHQIIQGEELANLAGKV